ncbi:MAG: HDOD domain-containing protein [Gammaproteobacteria bacterium]|nr:HDOD domain-containing protein [Gammaproteobacteria bacterium]
MVLTAQALVDDVGALVSLPEVVLRVNEMVNDEHTSAADIAKVISQDPGLATRLLKIANSPMYGSMRQIDSISRAVTILGTKQIRDLVISTTAAKVFEGIPNDVISVADFWHHSLYCALLARVLATHSKKANADTLFTAGLLHDIGHLIMLNRIPQEELAAIMLTVQGEASRDLIDAERELLGFDHTEVGAQLAQQWHLPELIVECIAHHHHPAQARKYPSAVAHIHIANAIASLPYGDIPAAEDLNRIDAEAWAMASLRAEDIGEAVQEAQTQIGATQKALFGDSLAG